MIRHLTTEQLHNWMANNQMHGGSTLLLVNVLSEEEHERVHIPGSHCVPVVRSRLENEVERLARTKHKPVIVYCASADDDASLEAARRLSLAGFTRVFDYSGGIAEWIESGHEVCRSG